MLLPLGDATPESETAIVTGSGRQLPQTDLNKSGEYGDKK